MFSVAGNQLAAVGGGEVTYAVQVPIGAHRSPGGTVMTVNLSTGAGLLVEASDITSLNPDIWRFRLE